MEKLGEVFISYSHDSVEHIQRVLALSNKLRSEGINCILDQYEESPPEGWPRWMDKKINSAQYVLMICTEEYYLKVLDQAKPGTGLGVKWEGSLIYQHIYNEGASNTKFIPVIFSLSEKIFIPTPIQGATFYCIENSSGYDDLYWRLRGIKQIEKPELGKLRPLPEKAVKNDTLIYLTSPINIDLWDKAKWRAVFYAFPPDLPPALGLVFDDRNAAIRIFEEWNKRYGENDIYEELRISIIEGDIPGEDEGYSVHIGSDPDAILSKFSDLDFNYDEDLVVFIGRVHRMNPPADSKNLDLFKRAYRKHKAFLLIPCITTSDETRIELLFNLGIRKERIIFRNVSEVGPNDIDYIAINPPDNKS